MTNLTCSWTLLVLVMVVTAADAQTPPTMKAVTTDEGVWLQEGDLKIVFYQRQAKTKDGQFSRANYLHPLLDLDGSVLTEDFPADHPHHRGLFWAWHQVLIGDKVVGDPWALKDFQWDIREAKEDVEEGRLCLRTTVNWLSPRWTDGKGMMKPFVREQAVIRAHRAEKDHRVLDFKITLTALEPGVRLGGAASPAGYGGFSPRLRLPKDVRFLGPKGEVEPLSGPVAAAPWIDVSGTFRNDHVSGVAMLIHPSTPGFPQPWVLRRSGSMQNAVYPGATAVSLPQEKPLVLRYRLVIHRGVMGGPQIDLWHKEYSQTMKP